MIDFHFVLGKDGMAFIAIVIVLILVGLALGWLCEKVNLE